MAHLVVMLPLVGLATCGRRVDVRFLPRPRLCRQLQSDSCAFFFITLDDGVARPCGSSRGPGTCTAGRHDTCATRMPEMATAGLQARTARKRVRRFLRRAHPEQIGAPCQSTINGSGDVPFADCEDWCTQDVPPVNDTLAPCRYCKCR